MKRIVFAVLIVLVTDLLGQVVVTPAANVLSVGSGASCPSRALTDIIISEKEKGDFLNTGAILSYQIVLPAGFVYDQSATEVVTYNVIGGTSSYTANGQNYPNDSVFRFTFRIDNTDNDTGYFRVSGLHVKCSVPGSFGNIYRAGASLQNANNPVDKVDHGYLDSRIPIRASFNEYDYSGFQMGYNGQYSYMQTSSKFSGTVDTTMARRDFCPYNTSYTIFTAKVTGSTYQLTDGTPMKYYPYTNYANYRFKSDSIAYYSYNYPTELGFSLSTGNFNIQQNKYTTIPTGNKNYVVRRTDTDNCLYVSDTIKLNALPVPAKWNYDMTKDTSFQQDDDPVALNDYISDPLPPLTSVSSLYGISGTGIVGINSNTTFLFMPGIVKVGTVYPNYVLEHNTSGCKVRYYFPKPIVVSDPLSPLPDFIQSSHAPPFCANGAPFTVNFVETPDPGYTLYYYYLYKKSGYAYAYDYTNGVTCGDITIDPKKDNPGNNLLNYRVYYRRAGLPDTSFYGYITLFAERNPLLIGLPDPLVATDSVVNICSSDNDTIFVRPTPANGALSIYRFNPTTSKYTLFKKASDYFKPIGGAGSKSTDFKFLIRQLFSDTAAADSNYNVKFKIVYSYPGTQYGQCPDTIIRVIKFSQPVDVEYSLTAPAKKPYCLGDTLRTLITYKGAIAPQVGDKFYWGFGDGVSREADSLLIGSYTYHKPGLYFLRFKSKLKSLPTGFCNNDQQDTIRIGAKPEASFSVFQNFIGYSADFHSLSKINLANTYADDTIVSRIWKYGYLNKVDTSQGVDTSFIYTVPSKLPYRVVHEAISGWGCKDSSVVSLPVFPVKVPTIALGVLDTFNISDVNGWFHSGQYKSTNISSWENRIPPDSITLSAINQFPTPIVTAESGYSWVTTANKLDSTATYYSNDSSYVESPVYNIKNLKLPMVSFSSFYNFDNLLDGASLQYAFCDSIAFGKEAWITLGNNKDGYNWYNSKTILGKPGNSFYGWTNDTLTKWQISANRLTEITDLMKTNGKKLVRFRIVLGTNGDNLPLDNKTFEGFAFDDFFIGERNRKVLIEEFCDYMKYEANMANKLSDPQAVRIQYHVRSEHKDDVINNGNVGENGARQLYYGLWKIPVGVLDGIYKDHEKPFLSWGENQLLKRTLIQSPFEVTINKNVDLVNKELTVNTTVKKISGKTFAGPFLIRTVIVEKSVTANSANFTNVFRSFIPNAAGFRIVNPNWANGTSVTRSGTWTPYVQPGSDLYIISFIQDDFTKEIYQVGVDSVDAADAAALFKPLRVGSDNNGNAAFSNATLFPNPATTELNVLLDGVTTLEHQWEIYDSFGRKLKSGQLGLGINLEKLSVFDLTPGVYYLKIDTNGGIINQSFSVVR